MQLSFNVAATELLKDLYPQSLLHVRSAQNEASWKASHFFSVNDVTKVLCRLLALLDPTLVMEML